MGYKRQGKSPGNYHQPFPGLELPRQSAFFSSPLRSYMWFTHGLGVKLIFLALEFLSFALYHFDMHLWFLALYFPCLSPGINHFPQGTLVPSVGGWFLGTKICVLDTHIALEVSLLLGPLSGQSQDMCAYTLIMYVHTSMPLLMSIYTCVCMCAYTHKRVSVYIHTDTSNSNPTPQGSF